MALEAEWSLDFCLSCDKQSTEGPYCSQGCRLADMERSGSPRSNVSAASSPSSSYDRAFHLPPAIDFSNYKSPESAKPSLPSKRISITSLDTSYSEPFLPRRDSTPGSPGMTLSAAARLELEQYENAFEPTRQRRHQQARQA